MYLFQKCLKYKSLQRQAPLQKGNSQLSSSNSQHSSMMPNSVSKGFDTAMKMDQDDSKNTPQPISECRPESYSRSELILSSQIRSVHCDDLRKKFRSKFMPELELDLLS